MLDYSCGNHVGMYSFLVLSQFHTLIEADGIYSTSGIKAK